MKLTLFCLLALTLCGCDRTPASTDGKRAVEELLALSSSSNQLKVVSFHQTKSQQGQTKNENGLMVQSYQMGFACTISSEQRCILISYPNGTVLTTSEGSPEFISLLNSGYPVLPAKGVTTLQGTIVFEMTDNGWRSTGVKLNKS